MNDLDNQLKNLKQQGDILNNLLESPIDLATNLK
jgi:hypothetical protein